MSQAPLIWYVSEAELSPAPRGFLYSGGHATCRGGPAAYRGGQAEAFPPQDTGSTVTCGKLIPEQTDDGVIFKVHTLRHLLHKTSRHVIPT